MVEWVKPNPDISTTVEIAEDNTVGVIFSTMGVEISE